MEYVGLSSHATFGVIGGISSPRPELSYPCFSVLSQDKNYWRGKLCANVCCCFNRVVSCVVFLVFVVDCMPFFFK